MFGTLMYDLQQNEPKFVENNAESVINRNKRGKPHIACEFCRARKLRCNGNPTGCDRCKSASHICKYAANRAAIRKRKLSTTSAKDTAQTNQSTHEEANMPLSPAISDHFTIEPSMIYQTLNQDPETNVVMGQLQRHNSLPKHDRNVTLCATNPMGEFLSNHNEKECQNDQIDQWLSSFSLLSPNGTIHMSTLKTGDISGPWQNLGKDVPYLEKAIDSEDDGASSQETQMEDFDMNDSNQVIEDSSSTPCLSSTSLDLLLDDSFSPNTYLPPADSPAAKNTTSQPSQKQAPMAYRMSAPAPSPISALLKNAENTYKKRAECRCLRLAAHLLEQLGNEGANTEQPTIDGLLSCCREAIKGCETILSCTLCKSRSESMMLLAMAGQYLSNICEKTVRCYVDVVQKAQPTNSSLTGGSAIWFCSYKMESLSERNQVIRCLVTGQLTEFCQLINKIKARVGSRKAQLAPLLGAERKIRCMRTMMMECENYIGPRSVSSEA